MSRTHRPRSSNATSAPMRYAHPYYTSTPPAQRPGSPTFGQRAAAWAQQQVGPIPPVQGLSFMTLDDVIGADGTAAVTQNGSIRFHAVGDTGRPGHDEQQQAVADGMAADYQVDAPGANPAFFLHLGDVIYGPNKDQAYLDEFYRPYMHYPGKIIAIPGNHDGEVLPGTDPESLQAFTANFTAPTPQVPPLAQSIGIVRQMVAQPGVYWRLSAPFVDIVGLYSNALEGPGALQGAGGDQTQIQWLRQTLQTISDERQHSSAKCLILTTHHPPYSSSGHSGSPDMLASIDAACAATGIYPDALLSGHAHNYQRYTRRVNLAGSAREIPYIVAGGGGHGAQRTPSASGEVSGDHTYDSSLGGYGYLLVTVSAAELAIEFWAVDAVSGSPPAAGGPAGQPYDRVTVDLGSHLIR